MSNRQKQYKNAGKAEDARRRRAEHSLELRKKKTDEMLMKRRNLEVEEGEHSEEDSTITDKKATKLGLNEIVAIVTTVAQPTLDQLHLVVRSLRGILSSSTCPPLSKVFDAGLGRVVAQLLTVDDELTMFEAMWCLTNMLSADSVYVKAMLDLNVLPMIIKQLNHGSRRVGEQSVWALANIFGDCAEYRDLCLQAGALDAICKVMTNFNELSLDYQRTVAWTLSNVLRHKNSPLNPAVVVKVIDAMKILFQKGDPMSLRDCYWGISYASDSSAETLQVLVDAGLVDYMVATLSSPVNELVPPVLRALGNVVASIDDHTQAVIDTGLFVGEALHNVFTGGSSNVRKETMWMLSNVCAGQPHQVQHIVDSEWLSLILQSLAEGDAKSQCEASYAISNMTHNALVAPCLALANADFATVAAQMIDSHNPSIISNVIDALHSVLNVLAKCSDDQRTYNLVLEAFEAEGGVDKLETLQTHDNNDIYGKAVLLIGSHFSMIDEENAGGDVKGDGEPGGEGVQAMKPFNF